ncbi:uncharacterized membrane protein YgdD (TMEM256/DUF423 family) [Rheinheimera pacifica]|uniref:DUF423 domain-containing protein n=1 Tax=Rheinheimera pacifica TaxID=173990 RepID=UPI002166E385|nr:DUF423 domain-containing protein [Rheinheimera pacifica]MCS4305696.1 uncharacterized membrane protein YgdD (TMEM256/DUF423 family) [Rheinheimera pacifica]
MKYFWQLSNSVSGLYGGAVVGLSAVLMHLWQGQLTAEAIARVISALAMLAFHALALLALGLQRTDAKLVKLVAVVWHLGLWFFVWTILAGVFALPFYYSQLAPIGGQLLIAAWLLFAVSAWRRS